MPASHRERARINASAWTMPWQDTEDFTDVEHGFIGRTPGIYQLH